MLNGPARFNFYLNRLELLLVEAATQPDAALYLYQNNARQPLFMLEGLAKLYGALHNKKKFGKFEKRFKELEDCIGAIDYYDNFAKDFADDKAVEQNFTNAVAGKAAEEMKFLNKLLIEKNWTGGSVNRISKMRRKLSDAKWLEDEAEVKAIESYYRKSIDKINDFAKQYETGFTELEAQVHELRRKLRWLSIYPQALQGLVQLTAAPSNDKSLAKYLTPEIVNSPFNKMPEAGVNRYVLTFNRDYFLSLSWMIAELGKLKDAGLRTLVLNEVGKKSPADAKDEAAILAKASEITNAFFRERNLDKLIAEIQLNK